MTDHWTKENMPDLTGKVAIVTGANSGIGYETAKGLAERGANVVLACRNLDKATIAANSIRRDVSNARLEIIRLDLADLDSVHEFSKTFQMNYDRLDILVNNAGVMTPPHTKTSDGFELQFGANHLGHFALTGHLLDTILSTSGARIINVSSISHRMGNGTIAFDNLNAEKGYEASAAYSQSKLANLLFTLELNQHFSEFNADAIAVASHPGWTATGLTRGLIHGISRVFAQSPAMGALPSLYAASAPNVQPNDYYGPSSLKETRGYPKKADKSVEAKDPQLAEQLWQVSEEMTAVHYDWNRANSLVAV